jgi:hypothetical protein
MGLDWILRHHKLTNAHGIICQWPQINDHKIWDGLILLVEKGETQRHFMYYFKLWNNDAADGFTVRCFPSFLISQLGA